MFMWLIRDIILEYEGIGRRQERYTQLFDFVHDTGVSPCLTLYNTATGESQTIQFYSYRDCLATLRSCHPYGFVDGQGMVGQPSYVIVVDDMSVQFLEYVDSVERVFIEREDIHKYSSVIHLNSYFSAMDSLRSLFECHVDTVHSYGTLFQVMGYVQTGWIGDDFYLYGGKKYEQYTEFRRGVDYVYKIVFCDIDNAKRMLLKAGLAYANPLREDLPKRG